ITTAGNQRITGVRVRSRTDGAKERTLPADLVIDCTGRGSRTSSWLRELGYPQPPTDELRIDLAYSSCHYRLPPEAVGEDVAIVIGPTPDAPYGGTLFRIEDDRWIVSLAGIAGTIPPTDPAAFESFAAGFVAPDIHAALTAGDRLDDPVLLRFPADVRRRYERLRRFPAGLLAAGDAVCAFNPIYGQGMSVAALEAERLRELLGDGGPPGARTWFRAVAGIVKGPWEMATGADLALPQVEGRRPVATRLVNAYLARYQAAAAYDPVLAERFIRVVNLLDGPQSLLHPANVRRTYRHRPGSIAAALSSLRPAGRRRVAWTRRSAARSSGSPTGSWPLGR
ncbi:MAG: NAD(P)/FAD-dependent oxidoreductase, partial [Nitriliruptoraceae bacterium]